MPVVTFAEADPVTVSGLDLVAEHVTDFDLADPVRVYGLPLVARTPDPTPQSAPDAVRAELLDFSGTFRRHLDNLSGLRWLDEHNTSGSGSIDQDLDTGVSEFSPGDHIKVYVGTRSVFRIILDAEPGYRIDTATGLRTDAWAGLGALGVLNSGMCIPEYGWRAEGTEERSFDYGSNPSIGGWLVPSEWKTPVGKLVRQSWRWTYKKRHLPKGWPDKKAQWLWWRNPDATNVANEVNYFRSSFVAPSAGRYRFSVCGDDTLEFQVDGEIRATTGPGGWRKTTKIVLHLSAGTHYLAAKVTNTSGSAGNQNRSGFLCSVARINGDGDVVTVARRTTPSTWTVRRQLTSAPGWYAAQILRQLVAEQQARGCAGHSGVTFGFSTAADSYGVPWAGRQELSVTVGTQALDYVQQMVETGLDVVMSPDLGLYVYRTRGADRSGWVRLNQHDAHTMEESGTQPPSIRNILYARALTGWSGVTHAASVAANGIREAMISLGSSRSLTQTAAALTAMLPDMAAPPRTVEIQISGATGRWQPYRDFYVSDWVDYKASKWSTWHRMRVMSIGGEVNPAGHPDWTIQLYEG
jgi:hypothetical protein